MRHKKRKQHWSSKNQIGAVAGIAWFDSEQWQRLREVAADPETLEDSHAEWLDVANRALRDLRSQGLTLEKVPLKIEELIAWSNEEGRPIDSAARAQFAALELRRARQSK